MVIPCLAFMHTIQIGIVSDNRDIKHVGYLSWPIYDQVRPPLTFGSSDAELLFYFESLFHKEIRNDLTDLRES